MTKKACSGSTMLAALVVFSLVSPGFAQLTLMSSSPANGETNVANPATFQLVFSSPLDTTARFDEPDDFFLNLEVFPKDSLGEPDDISLSPDFKTVTVSGLELSPDTRFTVLLTGAKSTAGDSLARPYVITFASGSTLPTGRVEGSVTFDGDPAEGTLVALFGERLLGEEGPLFMGVAMGIYSIDFVPDGIYTPVAVIDSNRDGEINPTGGDATGTYDANSDGQPDTIVISGGNVVSGIDMTLVRPIAHTARTNFLDIESAALAWASDAVLVEADADEISTQGQAFGWDFIFYSPTLDQFYEFFSFSGTILSDSLNGEHHAPDSTALPSTWIDSDAAASVAESNGGSGFRANFADAEVRSSLEYFHLYYEEEEEEEGEEGASKIPSGKSAFSFAGLTKVSATPARLNEIEPKLAVWRFDYWSEESNRYTSIEVNAETGALLASDALSNLDAASEAAEAWASDAAFIHLRNDGELSVQGRASVWAFTFQSTALDSTIEFIVVSGTVFGTRDSYFKNWPWGPLPASVCNSTDALAIAEPKAVGFRATHSDAYVHAELTRGFNEDPTRPVWRIKYHSLSNESLEIVIAAETCALLTDVAETGEAPEEFTLAQNYPNPFNPNTEISYNLPVAASVKLTIFNLLGQEINTVVDAFQRLGSHTARWNGRDKSGHPAPSGVYVYELRAGEFRQSKQMLLIR